MRGENLKLENWYKVAMMCKDDLFDAWIGTSVDAIRTFNEDLRDHYYNIYLYSDGRFTVSLEEKKVDTFKKLTEADEILVCSMDLNKNEEKCICFVSIPAMTWIDYYGTDRIYINDEGEYQFYNDEISRSNDELSDMYTEFLLDSGEFEKLILRLGSPTKRKVRKVKKGGETLGN